MADPAPITDFNLLDDLNSPEQPQPVHPDIAQQLDQMEQPQTGVSGALHTMFAPYMGVLHGMGQPLYQGARMLARGLAAVPPITPDISSTGSSSSPLGQAVVGATDAANRAFEDYYSKTWRRGQTGPDYPAMAGNAIATMPLAYAMPEGMVGAALGGAASGALSPVSPDTQNFWGQTGQNAALGGAGGAAAAPVFGALGRVVQPIQNSAVQRVMDMGANLTPGQMAGGMLNTAEQRLTSFPVMGDFIKSGRYGAMRQWNEGLINNALEPIGQKIEPGLADLPSKIENMQTKWSDHFNELVPSLGVPTAAVDPVANNTLVSGLNAVMHDAAGLARGDQLKGLVQTRILDRMSPGGGLTGATWQEADSYLNRIANNPRNGFIYSHDPDVQALGEAVNGTRRVLMDSLTASDPAAQQALMQARASYTSLSRVEDAAARAAKTKSPDVITPSQYMSAIAAQATKKRLAANTAIDQPEARAGLQVLANTEPDSGTAGRHAMQLGGAGLMALMGGHAAEGLPLVGPLAGYAPAAFGAYGALSGLTGAAYSSAGRAALAAAMRRPAWAGTAANEIRGLTPAAAATFGSFAPQQ